MRIPINEVIVCEGKYDKIKLESLIDADIITLDGFGIFKSEEKKSLIREAAKKRGLIVITDSDGAGMLIRNYIKNITNNEGVYHLYIPRVEGKESRKTHASKEGVLGVEGIDADTLRAIFERFRNTCRKNTEFSRQMLYEDGFIGCDGALQRRELLCHKLGLPKNMSTSALLSALTIVTSVEEYKRICEEIKC